MARMVPSPVPALFAMKRPNTSPVSKGGVAPLSGTVIGKIHEHHPRRIVPLGVEHPVADPLQDRLDTAGTIQIRATKVAHD